VRRLVPAVPVAAVAGPLAVLVLLLVPGASATARSVPGAGTAGSAADDEALRLLERAAEAPSGTAYQGVQYVSAWSGSGSTSLVVQVEHRPGYGTVVRSDGSAATPSTETFVPAGQPSPSVLGNADALAVLARNYVVSVAGRGSVAGREADLVEARRGGGGVAARFWLDEGTGLVLRREVYDERGRVTRASSFVDVEVGRSRGRMRLPPAMPDPWVDRLDATALGRLRSDGWSCPDRLPRGLHLVDARQGGSSYDGIVHLSYTDGLATVSLFEQRGSLDAGRLEGFRRDEFSGAEVWVRDDVPMRVVWSAGGRVFTLVADAPRRTVTAVVTALPHDAPETGVWNRLGRGLARVGSWFNPFG
jgi:sigma-E factor negative regulatory protein RseB